MTSTATTWAGNQTLRTSVSANNVGGSGWNGIGGSGMGKERRKSSVASLKQHYNQPQASSASTSLPSPTSPPPQSPRSFETDASGSGSGGSQLTARVSANIRKARRTSYFDYYPERNTARNREASASGASTTATKPGITIAVASEDSEFGVLDLSASPSSGSISRKGKEKDRDTEKDIGKASPAEETFAFPSIRERRNGITQSTSKTKQLSPSAKVPYLVQDDVPGLRFSYSSSQTTQAETETPPQTPVDTSLDTSYSLPHTTSYLRKHSHQYSPNDPYRHSLSESFDPDQVLVAAPISGVEAMDALVDGMDGSDDDDLFKRMQMTASPLSLSFTGERDKVREVIPSFHPLYAPPLPKPPPGIKLGGALPRGYKSKSRRSRPRADILFGVDGGQSNSEGEQDDYEHQRRGARRHGGQRPEEDLEGDEESDREDSQGEEATRIRDRTAAVIDLRDDGSGASCKTSVTPTRPPWQQHSGEKANSASTHQHGIEGHPLSASSSITKFDSQAMTTSVLTSSTSLMQHNTPSVDDMVRRHAPPPPSSPRVPSRSSSANATLTSANNSNYYGLSRNNTGGSRPSRPSSVVPSIDEIIRKNSAALASSSRPQTGASARPESRATSAGSHGMRTGGHGYDSAQSLNGHGHANGLVSVDMSDKESEPEPLSPREEAELVARSSIDSVAAEVQQTLRAAEVLAATQQREAQTKADFSAFSKASTSNSRSVGGSSIHSGTNSHSGTGTGIPTSPYASPDADLSFLALQSKSRPGTGATRSSQKEAIATYLRSARVTTLLKLTRRPHASPEAPLTVSLSDLGSPTGFPLIVFLGLGCVRYVMGLYDEMAECLGLRLITIDRSVLIGKYVRMRQTNYFV